MRKIGKMLVAGLIVMAAIMCLMLLAGCKTPNIQLEDKAVTVKGYSAINLLRTGYDPATQTITPSYTSIISSGIYSSVPTASGHKDFVHYSRETNTSIFNSQSKDTQEILVFASSDPVIIKTVVDALAERLKTANDPTAEPDSGAAVK